MKLLTISLFVACCVFGQKQTRPEVPLPPALNPDSSTPPASAKSFGDLHWFEVFQDDELVQLVHTALDQNFDVLIAVNNVLQAQQQVRITGSQLFPQVNAGLTVSRGLTEPTTVLPAKLGGGATTTLYEFTGSASWEVDLWGRLRGQTRAARETFLATQENRNQVVASLVYNVVAAYLNLRELDNELAIAKQTLANDQQSVDLTRIRMEGGVATMVDVRQAESLAETAAHAIPLYEQQIREQEDYINVLLGRNPGPVPRGKTIADESFIVSVPEGLPSSLLDRRPDIRMAERELLAARAEVSAARALFFPAINLTSFGGALSKALDTLFNPGTQLWSFAGSALQPVFEGGRLRANYKLSRLQQEQAALQYQKTVKEAFREVADALISVQKLKEARLQQQALTETLRDESDLSLVRYQGGVTTFLETLNAESQYFSAQSALSQAQRDELLSVVQLYKALGGGWQR